MAQRRLSVAQLENELHIIRAPVSGQIQEREVNTVGEIVGEGALLMKIAPSDYELSVHALVLNKDIGFLEEGLPVEIKVESFPFTKFGVLEGTLETISLDAKRHDEQSDLREVFPVIVRLDTEELIVNGEKKRLNPGMNVTAEVKTDRRTVI